MYHKAPVDCKDCKDYTPLFYACKAANLEVIYELHKHGSNINHRSDVTGKTPLFRARTEEVVDLLLNYGADISIKAKDDEGSTAIEYLMKYSTSCPKAILDNCLSRQQDNMLVLDFQVFELGNEEKCEMSLYETIIEKERHNLLLHPLMQIFLCMKVKAFSYQFQCKFWFQLMSTLLLTWFGIMYVDLNRCSMISNDVNDGGKCCTNSTFNQELSCDSISNEPDIIESGHCFRLSNDHIGCHCNESLSVILNLTNLALPVRCTKKSLRSTKENHHLELALVKQAIGPHGFWNHELCLFGASLLVLILVTREFHELFAHKKFYFMNRENYIPQCGRSDITIHEKFQRKPVNPSFLTSYVIILDQN